MLFKRYIPGEGNPNEIISHVYIGSIKNRKLLISILMHLQSNMFNMIRILVVLVAWNMLCLMPDNTFGKQAIASQLESSLLCESFGYMDRINFANKIIPYRVMNNSEKHHHYNIRRKIV